ncbi:MAG: hypothetical protein AAGA48_30595 [Myxococcota bacterium]
MFDPADLPMSLVRGLVAAMSAQLEGRESFIPQAAVAADRQAQQTADTVVDWLEGREPWLDAASYVVFNPQTHVLDAALTRAARCWTPEPTTSDCGPRASRPWEISRFGLDPHVRGAGLSSFLAWATCAWALAHGSLRPIVFRVPLTDASAYARLVGAQPVNCVVREHYGVEVGLLEVRATRLPDVHRKRLERYAALLDAGQPLVDEPPA